jgi:hypothetical protein
MKNAFVPIFAVLLSFSISASSKETPYSPFQIDEAHRNILVSIIGHDPSAKELFATIKKKADGALKTSPNPIPLIRSEGLLNSDPKKKASSESLRDMDKIRALGIAWTVLKDAKYLDKAREYLLAWAAVNKSAGDPIDDTNLENAILTYDFIKNDCTDDEKSKIDAWFSQAADEEIRIRKKYPKRATAANNWNSHRLKVVGLIGLVTGNSDYISFTKEGYKNQIQDDLRADGSSFDFGERDAMHYHLYSIEPLLSLASAFSQRNIDLYTYVSPSGASLPKSCEFILPYVKGEKTHKEYVNSKVKFDRDRAAAGQKNFAAGREFEPKEALLALNLWYYFNPGVLSFVQEFTGKKGKYPTWEILLYSVQKMKSGK